MRLLALVDRAMAAEILDAIAADAVGFIDIAYQAIVGSGPDSLVLIVAGGGSSTIRGGFQGWCWDCTHCLY